MKEKSIFFELKACLLAIVTLSCSLVLDAQSIDINKSPIPVDRDTNFYVVVDEQAMFMNGTINEFNEYIRNHLIYPESAKHNKIEGRTTVQFGVNCFGDIGFVKILRGSGNEDLDNAAISVVKSSPKWFPAKIGNKYVGQNFVSIIRFYL